MRKLLAKAGDPKRKIMANIVDRAGEYLIASNGKAYKKSEYSEIEIPVPLPLRLKVGKSGFGVVEIYYDGRYIRLGTKEKIIELLTAVLNAWEFLYNSK